MAESDRWKACLYSLHWRMFWDQIIHLKIWPFVILPNKVKDVCSSLPLMQVGAARKRLPPLQPSFLSWRKSPNFFIRAWSLVFMLCLPSVSDCVRKVTLQRSQTSCPHTVLPYNMEGSLSESSPSVSRFSWVVFSQEESCELPGQCWASDVVCELSCQAGAQTWGSGTEVCTKYLQLQPPVQQTFCSSTEGLVTGWERRQYVWYKL